MGNKDCKERVGKQSKKCGRIKLGHVGCGERNGRDGEVGKAEDRKRRRGENGTGRGRL